MKKEKKDDLGCSQDIMDIGKFIATYMLVGPCCQNEEKNG